MSFHKRRFGRALPLLLALFAFSAAAEPDEVPDYEVRQVPQNAADAARPMPKFRFLFGSPATWPGAMRWKYNHAKAPPPFDVDKAGTVTQIQAAFDKWTQACGVQYVYEGETTTPPNNRVNSQFGEQPDYENVVGWDVLAPNTAGVTYSWYSGTSAGREIVDSDVIFSTDNVRSNGAMDRTASHEWGHALGLDHSDYNGTLMSGPPDTLYNSLASPVPDDLRGCRCLYGPAAGQRAGYACGVPRHVDLGIVGLGAGSPPRAVTLRNDGNGPLNVNGAFVVRLSRDDGCSPGTVLGPGQSCTVHIVARPVLEGPYEAELRFETSDGTYPVTVTYQASSTQPPGPATVQLIEYHHAAFGHYFVTYIADEIAKLDNGTFPGWARTGRSITAWLDPSGTTVPVCRFFSAAFAPKSSHFYTSSPSECQTVKGNGDWSFEGEVFHVASPDSQGNCAAGTQPVYRLYNNGQSGAPNHRFTTSQALRQQMIGEGWTPEGAGLGVTMCAPL